VLREQGALHEATHLATLGPFKDLRSFQPDERVAKTLAAIRSGDNVIYQPRFVVETELAGVQCSVVGEPDFLIRSGSGYVIRDAKMARRITDDDHPEVLRQIETYGWLYERATGTPPVALEAFSGTSDIVAIAPVGANQIETALAELVTLMTATAEPYSPVGWTKCGACAFHDHCWPRAVAEHDVALIPKVDQGLATALRQDGVVTREQLLQRFDEASLSVYQRPWGARTQKVGKAAAAILRSVPLPAARIPAPSSCENAQGSEAASEVREDPLRTCNRGATNRVSRAIVLQEILCAFRSGGNASKTEGHANKETRMIPLFPELLAYLQQAFEDAAPGDEFVISDRYRKKGVNLGTQLKRFIRRAGLTPWPRVWHNLRASCQTELSASFPLHVVCTWLGNTTTVATQHYLTVRESDFEAALNPQPESTAGLQNALQHTAETPRTMSQKAGVDSSPTPILQGVASECDSLLDLKMPPEGLEPSTR